MPEISVIVPVYNVEKYLNRCINSILAQTFTDFELILVDDGSTDNSPKICDEYAKNDHRVVVIHKENGGVSSARNMGLKYAASEYVTFIDADDEVLDTYLMNLYKYNEYDYVVSGAVHKYINENNNLIKENATHFDDSKGTHINELPKDFFYNGIIHPCWGKLYKREIIIKNNIKFQSVRCSEDSLFNLQYLPYASSWKLINKQNYIYFHRIGCDNATSKFFLSDIDVYIQLHNKLEQMDIDRGTIKKTIYAQYFAICLRLIKSDVFDNAKKKEYLKIILSNKKIKRTLLFTFTNKVEWLTGVIICFANIDWINKWLSIFN